MTSIPEPPERTKDTSPELLGVRLLEASPKQVRGEVTVRDNLCTLPGMMNGGVVMAFAENRGAVPHTHWLVQDNRDNIFRLRGGVVYWR